MTVQKTQEFAFGTFNAKGVHGGMPREHIDNDLDTLMLRSKQKFGRELDVLGLQEFWPTKYEEAIRESFGATFVPGRTNSVAIWTNNDTIEYLSNESHFGHGAVIIDGKVISDVRPIEVVIVRDRKTGVRFAVVSGHPVPGAWLFTMRDGRRVWIYKTGWRKRRAAWTLWRSNLMKVLRNLVSRGLPIVICLDANKSFPPKLLAITIDGMTLRHVRNGIDWLIFVDSKKHRWVLNRDSKWIVKALFSDHDAILILAKLVVKSM